MRGAEWEWEWGSLLMGRASSEGIVLIWGRRGKGMKIPIAFKVKVCLDFIKERRRLIRYRGTISFSMFSD